ncbi:MAG: prephenate dehydratase [Deltaproteobacteria bacterium]|nr:prephenate dehydratase [Deltaproteobacteria bacterium]
MKAHPIAQNDAETELREIREAIDQVDLELLRLLNRRMELAQEVGRIKAAKGLSLFDPSREQSIYERLTQINPGPLSNESLRSIYREILAASRLLQYVLRVAFLGPAWTYSHLAAMSLYGHSAVYEPFSTLEDVFDALQKGKSHVAIVPVENSLQGGVGRTIDLLYEREVGVVRECYLEVTHYLCSTAQDIAQIQRLYAHPQAVEQCRRWILEHLRSAEIYECSSTAQAAQMARKDTAGAALCNLYAAHHYGLDVLAERIEDHTENTTRFLALADHPSGPTGSDKTSILFTVADRPGALHTALEAFARHRVNMSRIESRPNRQFPWQYLFCVDIEGHMEEEPVRSALDDLGRHVTLLKLLGSYPKSDPKRPIRVEMEKMRTVGQR